MTDLVRPEHTTHHRRKPQEAAGLADLLLSRQQITRSLVHAARADLPRVTSEFAMQVLHFS